MRKVYTLLLSLFLISTGANGQTSSPIGHSKRVFTKFKSSLNDFQNLQSSNSNNSDGEKKQIRNIFTTVLPDYAIWYNDDPERTGKEVFYNDEENRIVTEAYPYDSSIETWVTNPTYKSVAEYDSQGRETRFTEYNFNPYANEFVISGDFIQSYYSGDKIKYWEEYGYQTPNLWAAHRLEYNYDNDGYMKEQIYSTFISGDDDWEEGGTVTAEYTLEGNKIFYDILLGSVIDSQEVYEYDEKGNEIYMAYRSHNNGVYELLNETEREFNNEGKKIKEEYTDYENNIWWRETYTYKDNRLTQYETFYYGENGEVLRDYNVIYYYNDTAIDQTSIQQNKVSFMNGVLSVESKTPELINVFTIEGSRIYSFNKNTDIHTESINLPNGIFIIKGSSGWSKKIQN